MKRFVLAAFAALAVALCPDVAGAETRLEIPGGWYSEAHPNRTYVAAVKGSHIQTHEGNVALPQGIDLLFVRSARDGSKFAGAGMDDLVWEFAGGGWTNHGVAFATNPVVYRLNGELVFVSSPGPTGSQGYRYVADDGRLVTGDESYADPVRGIWEYTNRTCAGVPITVGQGGDEEGTQALVAGRRVLIEPGVGRRVVFNCEGNQVAIAIAKFAEAKAVLIWTTVEELQAKPTYVVPGGSTPPPPVVTPPPPPPTAECGEVPSAAQSALRTLAAKPDVDRLVRSQSDDDRRVAARMFAEQVRFLLGPEWGSKSSAPTNPQSKDAIARQRGTQLCVWDLVNGATRELHFGHGEDATGQHFIAVSPINHIGAEPPPVEPPPDTSVIDALRAEIAALNRRIADSEAQNAALRVRIAELESQLDAATKEIERLRRVPPKECEVTGAPSWLRKLFGISCSVKQVQ